MITNKRILIVTTTDSMIGQFLLPHIKQLTDSGNIVECACHKTGFWFDEMVKDGLRVYEIPFARNPLKPTNLKAKKMLLKLCKENKYDLIHCHTPVGGVMGRIVGKKLNIPVLYIAHGFHFYKGAPLINTLIYKNIEKHYAKFTDALVVMNNEDFEAAKKMKAKRVYKINGIGLLQQKTSAGDLEKLKLELNISDDDIVLLSVGELNENKNHIAVLKALLKLDLNNIKYFVCGRGNKLDFYNEFIKENNLSNNVKFLGFRRDVLDILKLTDIFIMPSIREGLPVSIMEAMDAGLPIIASNIRGCVDLVTNNGILVNLENENGFADAIKTLVDNKDLREQMGKNSKTNIKGFYIDTVLGQMEKIYDNIFNVSANLKSEK